MRNGSNPAALEGSRESETDNAMGDAITCVRERRSYESSVMFRHPPHPAQRSAFTRHLPSNIMALRKACSFDPDDIT
jgi:hypothetical protein